MPSVLPPILAIILPLLASPIAARLGKDRLPRLANASIALVIVLASAVAWGFFATSLTSNISDDIALIGGYTTALLAVPLHPLYAFLDLSQLFGGPGNTKPPTGSSAPKPIVLGDTKQTP